jgi:hypothetical protein
LFKTILLDKTIVFDLSIFQFFKKNVLNQIYFLLHMNRRRNKTCSVGSPGRVTLKPWAMVDCDLEAALPTDSSVRSPGRVTLKPWAIVDCGLEAALPTDSSARLPAFNPVYLVGEINLFLNTSDLKETDMMGKVQKNYL